MMPCRPPMMLVSMLGQAIFHTAERSGPSVMERSYRRLGPGAVVGAMVSPSTAAVAGFVAPVESLMVELPPERYRTANVQIDTKVRNLPNGDQTEAPDLARPAERE